MATVPPDAKSNDTGLTHLDASGRARMVDVTGKQRTHRVAIARAAVVLSPDLIEPLEAWESLADMIESARYAGIMAAKQTAKLIPLCHPIEVDSVVVEVRPHRGRFDVQTIAQIVERTGVEMEALTACAVTALTLVGAVHDRDPGATVEELTLWHKSGGRSGTWNRSDHLSLRAPSSPHGPEMKGSIGNRQL
jgi:cyclic pyranopterin monophosphate synthase